MCPLVCLRRRDLGPGDFDSPRSRRGHRRRFRGFVADATLNVQHFQVSDRRRTALTSWPARWSRCKQRRPRTCVAGDGSRVIVAYSRLGQTHMRISEDYGATFGPRIVVSTFCRDCPEGGSQPMGIDARNGDILVEVLSAGGAPPDYSAEGYLTHNEAAAGPRRHPTGARSSAFSAALRLQKRGTTVSRAASPTPRDPRSSCSTSATSSGFQLRRMGANSGGSSTINRSRAARRRCHRIWARMARPATTKMSVPSTFTSGGMPRRDAP